MVAAVLGIERVLLQKQLHSLLRVDFLFPAGCFVLIVALCFLGPELFHVHSPVGGNIADSNLALWTDGHVLGTDLNGNDVLSRLLHGGRLSILLAVLVNTIGLIAGSAIGLTCAMSNRVIDTTLCGVVDIVIAFPSLVLALCIAATLGPGLANTAIALASISVPAFARMSRSVAKSELSKEYILAATIAGSTRFRIATSHVFGHIAPQLVIFWTIGMGLTISLEGALSYLGLGVRPPGASWGNMIAHGQNAMLVRPSLVILPALAIIVTVLCLNAIAEAVRRRFNSPDA